MSRVIEHRFIFGDEEKGYLSDLMRRLETFSDCKVMTYVFMDNHFHILLHVPERREIDDDEVKRRVAILYEEERYATMEENWKRWIEKGGDEQVKEQLDGFRARMYDLSEFMKTFKQRVSIYYNAKHDRHGAGPLWQDRFKSVLLDEQQAQLLVATYIDLNPVRAGIVNDPKDYRWSGYAEAVGAGGLALDGISNLFMDSTLTKKEVLAQYRQHLYCVGAQKVDKITGEVIKPGFDCQAIDKVLEAGGELSIQQLLRCRMRYLSDGVVLGSKAFVERMLAEHSHHFSALRCRRGASSMKHGESCGLCTVGDFRSTVVFPSAWS
ncbi:MAG: hypothetical protein PHO37_04960 [Kiritimatiellae bacterium]|nr:hypothetical protein [Kiritimatiellia bacterium]